MRNTVLIFSFFLAAFAFADEGRDRVVVKRDEQLGTLTILIRSPEGLLEWRDVVRGLARAAEFDEEAAVEKLEPWQLDLRQRRTWFTVRALSAVMPDVKLRVRDDADSGEPSLSIRLERDETQEKTRRVKALLRDLFAADVDPYRFQLDEQWKDQSPERPLVVLIHGYGTNPRSVSGFQSELKDQGWPFATFSYPNDGPLAASGKRLADELRKFRDEHPQRNVVIVAHSMGGLVARAAIEDPALDPGHVTSLIMICTPNHGSRWAELPNALDIWEHLHDLPEHSIPEAFRNSFADGLNEARADMELRSRFLRELNARPRNPRVRYSLILGTEAPYTAEERTKFRQRTIESLSRSRAGRIVSPKVNAFLEDFDELERGKGDWVVSVERGRLEGVPDTVLLPITHWTFSDESHHPKRQKLFEAVMERIAATASK